MANLQLLPPPLMLIFFYVLQLVNSAVDFRVIWTSSEVLAINQEVTLRQGDNLVLVCPPNSFSNAVLLDVIQWSLCNSSATTFTPQLLGFCDGSSLGSEQTISVSAPTFSVGMNYIASTTDGSSLSEAMRASPSDPKNLGECIVGLRITLNVQSPPNCVTPPSPVVVVSNEGSRVLEWTCEAGFVPSDTATQLTSTCEVNDIWVPPVECLVDVPGGCGGRAKWDVTDKQNNILLVNTSVNNFCVQCIYSPPAYRTLHYYNELFHEALTQNINLIRFAASFFMGVFVVHNPFQALGQGEAFEYVCTVGDEDETRLEEIQFEGPTFIMSDSVLHPISLQVLLGVTTFEEQSAIFVSMRCVTMNSRLIVQFTWYLDNVDLAVSSFIYTFGNPITLDDAGLYKCEVSHPVYGYSQSSTTRIFVTMVPRVRFGFEQTVYTVNEIEGSVTVNIIAFDNVTRLYPLNFFIANGTATEFNDFLYLGSTYTLEFDVNVVAFQINISVYYDFMIEGTEEFFIHLSSDYFAVRYENNLTTIKITDGDASFTNLSVESDISGNPQANLLLLCNASYPVERNALDSMANISWSTEIDGVDISDQTVVRREEIVASELLLANASSRFCGVYSCSATDRYTPLPSTISTNVDINTAPVITSSPMDVEALPNSLISFECVILSEPGSLVNVTWFGPDPLPSFETTSLGNTIQTNITFNVQNGSNAGLPYNCSASYYRCTASTSASAIFSIIVIPIIIELPQNQIGRYLSSNNSIYCIATDTGALSISWTGPSTVVPVTTTTGDGNRMSVLNFDQVQYSEGGEYTCIASNEAGSVNASAILFVEPQIFQVPSDGLVRVDEMTVLMCMVQDDQFVSVLWQKQNLTFENIPGEIERNLTFSPIQFGDEGVYRCIVTTLNFGVYIADAFILSVAPGEVNITGSTILAKNGNLSLTCSNFGGPDNTYNWQFNDALLPEETTPNFQLEQVDSSDGGTYTCTVTNRAGNNSDSISLSIEPYITMFPLLFIEAEVGSPAIFSCMAEGFPEPVITWLKISGFGVISGMDVIASSNGTLEFISLSYEDNGTYVCEASAQSPNGIQLQTVRTPITVVIVTCTLPLPPPMNGMLGNISSQNVGSTVQFWCNAGYRPSAIMTTTCNSTVQWDPPPEELVCVFVEANLTLIELPRMRSSMDIDCPGNTIAFTCIVHTNSENPQLTWRGTFPEMFEHVITFNSSSELTTIDLGVVNVSLLAIRTVSFLEVVFESRFELTVLTGVDLNQTLVECLSESLDNMSLYVDVDLAAPLTPTGFLLIGQAFTVENVTVTFAWDEPQGSGPETVIDYYNISIVPSSLSFPNSTAITTMQLFNITVEYNVVYEASLTAANCAGISEIAALPENFTYVNCGDPVAPINGTLVDIPDNTRLGATVYYRCDDGFRPSANFTSICESTGMWIPPLENHDCIFVSAMVSITELPRNNSRNDIECPGDILPYMCSVRSNSETIELSWQITFPGQDTIFMFVYTNDSERNVAVYRPMNLTARLTRYELDQDVESVLELTVLRNVSMNGTLLECRSEDLASENVTVVVNSSIPLIPSGFAIVEEYYSDYNLTVRLEWDEPQGSGPETVVDVYIIAISPRPVFPSSDAIVIPNSPQALNVTLNYNTNYTMSITAENCAGESEAFVYPNVTRYVNCGILQPPVNGSIDLHDHTREGISVNYRCDDGFRPSANFTTRCESTQLWTPLPRDHNCTFVSATIFLTTLSSSFPRTEIDCPGDTITYRCLIQSNSEMVQLMWLVTLPGQEALTMLYVDGSDVNLASTIGLNITTILRQYILDELIESEITLTILRNVSMNGTLIECRSEDLGRETETLYVNSLVPSIPIGFNITDEVFTVSNITVIFEWNEPTGSASEGIVDNYFVTISPMPLHPLSSESILPNSSRRFDIVLNYNTLYNVSIFAENCAGQSEVFVYPDEVLYVNCGNPVPPDNGTVDIPEYTREGASVDYRCNEGFRPSRNFTSTCASTELWTPLPQNHICEFVTARIIVTALQRNPSRNDIECPGDRLPYMCSVRTNSETVELEWRITFPGQDTIIMIIYMNSSDLHTIDYLPMNISATLTQFIPNEDVLSTLMLTVLRDEVVDGTIVECRSGGLASDNVTVAVNISVPLVPTEFNITNVFFTDSNIAVTFEWEPPRSSGVEAVVDYYIITISPSPLSPSTVNVLPNSLLAFNVTFDYNTGYTASIVAENCAGRSNTYQYPDLIRYVNCGVPKPPVNGSVDTPAHTREGTSIYYRCDEGFRPSANFTSTCKNSELWTPLPENHTCTFVKANLTLALLQRAVSRNDIDCPGDTIHYKCSVQSNSEMVQLQWIVTFLGQQSFTMLYTNNSPLNIIDILGMNVTSILTDYQMDELVISNLTITVLQNVSMNGTLIECRSEELDAATVRVYVNTSEPLMPFGFNITDEVYDVPDLTITFEWDSPRGEGPEVIVDSYIVTITPRPLSASEVSILSGSYLIWSVTLSYNINYMATITAENCAGQSDTYVYPSIIEYVNCGTPIAPTNGSVDTPDHTREGATVYYRCNNGFRPSADSHSICESTALWTPPPQNHNCTFITATVSLFPLPRNTSRQDIECPGDTIPYGCSVQSNSENVQLEWLITFPGYATIIMRLYNDSSGLNAIEYLPRNVTAIQTQYITDERVESEIVLTILRNVSMNGTIVECRSEELDSELATINVNTSVPLPPSSFNITGEFYGVSNLTIRLEWIEPQGSGPETIVDTYTLEISPMPLYPYGINVLPNFLREFNVTLGYNIIYTATIFAENCAGVSELIAFPSEIEYVNCGDPPPPANGSIFPFDHTREGASVDYRCDDGFRPSPNFTSTCQSTGMWMPSPELHHCTFIEANITLSLLQRSNSRQDIECPGDTISYMCSVQSNSENVQLEWLVTFPEYDTVITRLFTSDSQRNTLENLEMNITVTLTLYTIDERVESMIVLTVLRNVSMNGTLLECRSEELASEIETVYVNTSVPLAPTGFNITSEFYTVSNLTITFEWIEPQGNGLETIVDNYIIVIFPMPLFPFSTNILPSFPQEFSVTLSYNANYIATLTAENCAGESESLVYPNMIRYVNCGVPEPPINGTVDTPNHTREGATVNYRCNDGFLPSIDFTATCESSTFWNPLPQDHFCTIANVALLPLSRVVSRDDIECPGDTIPFQCSVESNSRNIVLEWSVTFPGQAPLNVTYTNFSATETVDDLGMNVTTVVTNNGRGNFIESVLTLTVLQDVSMNGTQVECRSADLDSDVAIIYVNTSVPNSPSGLSIVGQFHTQANTTITFSWVPPQGSGVEIVVDMYHFFISPKPLSHQTFTVVYGTAINVTIENNRLYNISVLAANCAGESSLIFLPSVEIIDCGDPEPPMNGFLGNYSTITGENVTFQCSMGYIPSAVLTSTCDSQGFWVPAPNNHTCTLVTAIVTLDFLGSTKASEEIDCPGDTVSFNCSIQSNTETLHLSWIVEIPDFPPIGITYNNMSSLSHENLLDMNVSTSLVALREGFLQSVITIVIMDALLNGTTVTCSIADLDAETKEILVNISEPLSPVNFNISGTLQSTESIEVYFEWKNPLGMGPDFFVQNYSIFVESDFEFYISDVTPDNTTVAFTLSYNVNYTAFAVAINCAGESEPSILEDILFVDCGIPTSPANASRINLPRTTPGAVVTFKCDPFFLPTFDFYSMCLNDGNWYPPPESHICLLDDRRTSPINITLGAVTSILPLFTLIIVAVAFIFLTRKLSLQRKFKRTVKPYGSERVGEVVTTDEEPLVPEADVKKEAMKLKTSPDDLKDFMSSLEFPSHQKQLFPSRLPPLNLKHPPHFAPLEQPHVNLHSPQEHYITKFPPPPLELVSLEQDSSKQELKLSRTPEQATANISPRLPGSSDLHSPDKHLPSIEKHLPSLDCTPTHPLKLHPLKVLPSVQPPSMQHPSSLPQHFQTSFDQQQHPFSLPHHFQTSFEEKLTPTLQSKKHFPSKQLQPSPDKPLPSLQPLKHSTLLQPLDTHSPALETVKHSSPLRHQAAFDEQPPALQPIRHSLPAQLDMPLDQKPPVLQPVKHSPSVQNQTSLDKQPPALQPITHSLPAQLEMPLDQQPPILQPVEHSPSVQNRTSFDKQLPGLQPVKRSVPAQHETPLNQQPPILQPVKNFPPVQNKTSFDKQPPALQPVKQSPPAQHETPLDQQPPILQHSPPVQIQTSFDKQPPALQPVKRFPPAQNETPLDQQPPVLQPVKNFPPVQNKTSFDKQPPALQPVKRSPPVEHEMPLDQQPPILQHSPPVQIQTSFDKQPPALQPVKQSRDAVFIDHEPSALQSENLSPPVQQKSLDQQPPALQPVTNSPPVDQQPPAPEKRSSDGGASSVAKWVQDITECENKQSPNDSQAQLENFNSLQSAPSTSQSSSQTETSSTESSSSNSSSSSESSQQVVSQDEDDGLIDQATLASLFGLKPSGSSKSI